ncbi:MAG: electron transport complex subunit RsxG [Gammaproteobacteria bacterium]|nr:MAG: electron transport complex subunit RsxG [Gammaproteobacteria bacterium]
MMRHVLTSTVLLALFGIAGAGSVAVVHELTKERIAANIRATMLKSLNDVLPPSEYDNDILSDTIEVWDANLTPGAPTTIYRARKDGQPVAAIFDINAPGGYGGSIHLLVGIRADGRLSGVRVVEHHETPGLGDAIEAGKSDWILQFRGLSLDNPPEAQWKVKRDGGQFDQFTGATITPRAVVKAVRNALRYYREHRDEIFTAPATPSAAEQEAESHE